MMEGRGRERENDRGKEEREGEEREGGEEGGRGEGDERQEEREGEEREREMRDRWRGKRTRRKEKWSPFSYPDKYISVHSTCTYLYIVRVHICTLYAYISLHIVRVPHVQCKWSD